MNSHFRGSAIIATALLAGSLTFSARPSAAEPRFFQSQQQIKNPSVEANIANNDQGGAMGASASQLTDEVIERPPAEQFAAPPTAFVATAYSLRGKTASGRPVAKGLIAADPRVLPLGSRVRLEASFFSGDYLVADTGGAVRGKRIDIWTPSTREAFRFGKRTVKLTVLSYGPKRAASRKSRR
jgi:3D (Asp-Asp-Asp) domain-containing protein